MTGISIEKLGSGGSRTLMETHQQSRTSMHEEPNKETYLLYTDEVGGRLTNLSSQLVLFQFGIS